VRVAGLVIEQAREETANEDGQPVTFLWVVARKPHPSSAPSTGGASDRRSLPMTEPFSLRASSGDEQIDAITSGVVAVLDMRFPKRIRGYFFEGSCADGGLTPLSDIDLCMVFADRQTDVEQHDFATLGAALNRISPRGLDLSCIDEAALLHADQLRFEPERGWQTEAAGRRDLLGQPQPRPDVIALRLDDVVHARSMCSRVTRRPFGMRCEIRPRLTDTIGVVLGVIDNRGAVALSASGEGCPHAAGP
jgi:hypothetical protein